MIKRSQFFYVTWQPGQAVEALQSKTNEIEADGFHLNTFQVIAECQAIILAHKYYESVAAETADPISEKHHAATLNEQQVEAGQASEPEGLLDRLTGRKKSKKK